jgi:hypothetical protein
MSNPRVRKPYGAACARDVSQIRKVVATKMIEFAKEWKEQHSGEGLAAYHAFLREKLRNEIRQLPVLCVRKK